MTLQYWFTTNVGSGKLNHPNEMLGIRGSNDKDLSSFFLSATLLSLLLSDMLSMNPAEPNMQGPATYTCCSAGLELEKQYLANKILVPLIVIRDLTFLWVFFVCVFRSFHPTCSLLWSAQEVCVFSAGCCPHKQLTKTWQQRRVWKPLKVCQTPFE